MRQFTHQDVREFLLTKYGEPIKGLGYDPDAVSDDFDFLLNGVIDSFGIVEMIGAIEEEFGIQLDMENLDAEQLTVLGSLSHYVAETRNQTEHD